MTQEEYNEELQQINQSYQRSLKDLYVKYAKANAKFKVGDIIKCGDCILLIKNIGTYKFDVMPEAFYSGIELTRQLTPKKRQSGVSIYNTQNIELIKPQP